MEKYYTNKQRLLYGVVWCLISFIIGGIFVYLDWTVLSYIAFAFGIMSLIAIKRRPN